jgi:hypothetical protein
MRQNFRTAILSIAVALGTSGMVSAGSFFERVIVDDTAVYPGTATVGAFNYNIPRDATYVHGANTNPFVEPQTVNGVTFTRKDFDQPVVRDTRYSVLSTGLPAGTSPAFQEVLQKFVFDIDQSMLTFSGIQAGKSYTLELFGGVGTSVRRAVGVQVTADGVTEQYGGSSGTWAIGGEAVASNYFSTLDARGVHEADPGVMGSWEALYYTFTATTNQDVVVKYLDHFSAQTSAVALVEGLIPEPSAVTLLAASGLVMLRRRPD